MCVGWEDVPNSGMIVRVGELEQVSKYAFEVQKNTATEPEMHFKTIKYCLSLLA